MVSLTFRSITEDERDAFGTVLSQTFGFEPRPEEAERFWTLLPLDRTVAAFDGDRLVGTGGGFPSEVTVSGGQLPMSGTTVVTVRPTHRRRGALRGMMRHHLDDTRERGEPLAGLWASEAPIYGRFGYGMAAEVAEIDVDGRTVEIEAPRAGGSLRMIDVEEAATVAPAVYERVRPTRPGMLTRSEAWWRNRPLHDPEHWRRGASAKRWAVYADEHGEDVGYVIFRQKSEWEQGLPEGSVRVEELMAATEEAHTELWRFLLNVDLFPKVNYWISPTDEPLPWKVSDMRRVQRRLSESIWIRILDVPGALSGRAYQGSGRLTFEVGDDFYPDLAGTYTLEVEDGVGECKPATAEPDVTLGMETLGAIFLGGPKLSTLAGAGRAAGPAESLQLADQLFGWHLSPWCPEVF